MSDALSAWVTGGNCDGRVVRGGSWLNYPELLRLAIRDRHTADNRNLILGVRLGRTQKDWRRLDAHNLLPKLILGVKFADGIEFALQAQAAAA